MPALVLARCDDEVVVAAMLTEAHLDGSSFTEGRVLWRVEAQPGRGIDRVVVGETPPGFRETQRLIELLPEQMVLEAEMDGGVGAFHGGYFRLDELDAGALRQHGDEASLADLRRDARANCDLVGLLADAALSPAVITAAVVGMGVLLLLYWHGRRRRAALRPF